MDMQYSNDIINTLSTQISMEVFLLAVDDADVSPYEFIDLAASVEPHELRELVKRVCLDPEVLQTANSTIPVLYHNIKCNRVKLLMNLDFNLIADIVRQQLVDCFYQNLMK